jgi:hypothetical protein
MPAAQALSMMQGMERAPGHDSAAIISSVSQRSSSEASSMSIAPSRVLILAIAGPSRATAGSESDA